jgi:hypothetical protein
MVPSAIVKMPKVPYFLDMTGQANLRPLAIVQIHGFNSAALALEHSERPAFLVFMAKA